VDDSKLAEILKLLFERTSNGTRRIGAPTSLPDNVRCTVLGPLLTTSTFFSVKAGGTERVTVSLTVVVSVTDVCASTLADTTSINAISVKT